jgi:hypothetical protein
MSRQRGLEASFEVPEKLLYLDRGNHEPNSERGCVMEAASWLAGEPWSDHPRSVHPVIAQAARRVNDDIDDDKRQLLWPLVAASLGTARRGRLCLRWRLEHARRHSSYSGRELWESLLALHAELSGTSVSYQLEVQVRVNELRQKHRPKRSEHPDSPTRPANSL